MTNTTNNTGMTTTVNPNSPPPTLNLSPGGLSRRGLLVAGAALAGAGLDELIRTPDDIKPAIPPAEPAAPTRPPQGFEIIDQTDPATKALITSQENRTLVFVGKDTRHIENHAASGCENLFFKDDGITEIHITDPKNIPYNITIVTPEYTRQDKQKRHTGYTGLLEQDRPKVDLCIHPSVLSKYIMTANGRLNGEGLTAQDTIVHFYARPGISSDDYPDFKIILKGHGIDQGGTFTDKLRDRAGIDRIKLVDSRGEVLKSLETIHLSTAPHFKTALEELTLAAERSIDATTPLDTGNRDALSHYADRRFEDINQSMGMEGSRAGAGRACL